MLIVVINVFVGILWCEVFLHQLDLFSRPIKIGFLHITFNEFIHLGSYSRILQLIVFRLHQESILVNVQYRLTITHISIKTI